MNLKEVIEKNNTKAGRIFDLSIQFIIIVSILAFTLETIPDLSEQTKRVLFIIEIISVAIFSVEYILRVYVADNKLSFIFSFYGLIDLLAILPFYIARGIDLRSLRILRLFRLIRIFKLLRYSLAIQRFRRAFSLIKEELFLFLIATTFVLYLASVGIYYFENPVQPEVFKSIFHSMWWAVETLTTVGYGDIFPVTTGGKVLTFFILMIGLGIVAIPAGLFASALTKCLKDDKLEV